MILVAVLEVVVFLVAIVVATSTVRAVTAKNSSAAPFAGSSPDIAAYFAIGSAFFLAIAVWQKSECNSVLAWTIISGLLTGAASMFFVPFVRRNQAIAYAGGTALGFIVLSYGVLSAVGFGTSCLV